MAATRRAYVDWLRGMAVLSMITWHVLDAWTTTAGRASTWWPAAPWIGGWAAPLFLFLAGVAVPFAIAGHVAKGLLPGRAAWLVERRGWQVFGIAHLMKLQSFLINVNAPLSSLVAPDILNILGLGLVGTAWLVGRVGNSTARRVAFLLVPAAIIVAVTPAAPGWAWPAHLPPSIEAYVRPNGMGLFRLFPSVAFIPLGAFVGVLIAGTRDESAERRLHARLAVAGALIAAIGYGLGLVRTPTLVLWTSVWSWPVWQFGVMTFALWASWALLRTWMSPIADRIWAPLIALGRTSLFVYWVHVELAYGVWSYPLHGALSLPLSAVGVGLMTVLMYVAAGWWNDRTRRPWIPAELAAPNNWPATTNR